MKALFPFLSLMVAGAAPAAAHTSLVPHDHPHAYSPLPDLLVLALAALCVGLAFAAFRRMARR
jgi:hypothetical protein